MSNYTKYQYITAGSRWGWGRNVMEETIWKIIRIVGIIMLILGGFLGGRVGIWLFQQSGSYSTTLKFLLPIGLILFFAWGLATISIILTYKISIFFLELARADKDANR